MTQAKVLVDNQDQVITHEKPAGNQGHALTREKPVVDNQGQDLEDDSVKQTHEKFALHPKGLVEELTLGGDDSIVFIEDRNTEHREYDPKRVPGGGGVSDVSSVNVVPVDSTSRPVGTVADPTRCVWAIISCCSPGSNRVRHPCFELLGCPGPFWDTNPCNKRMIGAAVKVAEEFYSSGKNE